MGNFYGVTHSGGDNYFGSVFQVTPNGTFTVLASFPSESAYGENPDPGANLILGADGNFYGTTGGGGSSGEGTVYQVTTAGVMTTLFTFGSFNGLYPRVNMTLGQDGNFYGTTTAGGTNNYGAIFQVTTNGTLNNLYSFPQSIASYGGLTLLTNGIFYGTTVNGGTNRAGTVFQLTANGTFTTLASFIGSPENNGNYWPYPNGANPSASLTLGPDGYLYGTANDGGNTNLNGGNGYGTIFRLITNSFPPYIETVFTFSGTNGASPNANLTLGPDGNSYGTTSSGGDYGDGTVFRMNFIDNFGSYYFNYTITNLASFNGTNGAYSYGGLTVGPDGKLYGTTSRGGGINYYGNYDYYNDGTVFQVTTNGIFTNLVVFTGYNGEYPEAGLTFGPDGNFYGTTSSGGNYSGDNYPNGTIFEMTTNGALATLFSFNSADAQSYPNGESPDAGLTLGPDGNLYGVTYSGGSGGGGEIYRLVFASVTNSTSISGFGENYGGPLILGESSAGTYQSGQLVVSNAGRLQSAGATLGENGVGNNSAVVAGAGSTWTSSGDVVVGQTGSGNQLVVSNDGTMVVTGNLTVGSSNSSNNLVPD